MKSTLVLFASLIALSAATSGAQTAATCRTLAPDAQDALTASPENHTVLYENADVRVLDVHSQPHTREAVHTHSMPSVMYVDRQGAGTYNTPDGSGNKSHPTDPNFKFRIFAIPSEGQHWTENTGEVPFHAVRVEFKHPGCGLPGWRPASPGPDDALVAAPANYTLLLENQNVRVLDLHLAPHATTSFHTNPWPGFFYVIQGVSMRDETKAGSQPEPRNLPTGVKILPAKAGGHTIENTSDTPLHLIRYELKFSSPPTP
ncbi:cupin domain-containing protein [Granulicella tundricola]|uniref:Cupin 2 conserved barrel domain protein n=1 Tax=Granulicella tundricola (strain ATCC BAA-1859 / DSM 23138 / MP5ACTX9) TaxID=1198114 RepID=E8X4W5_GRATM|nr:hypothetical protein [Granulicella tundricola]ADW70604.1 hypothetical protein AciX9_3601 [Granulicella tundricola MP5ACTX9]